VVERWRSLASTGWSWSQLARGVGERIEETRKEEESKGGKRRKTRRSCVCVCEGGPKTKTKRIGRRTGTSWTGWITLVVIFGWWITVAETKGFGNEETMCIMKS